MLPDATLPELDDTLAESSYELLVLRYATGDIVKRVEAAYRARMAEQGLPRCAGPLVFYFLKYDRAFGERLLQRRFR